MAWRRAVATCCKACRVGVLVHVRREGPLFQQVAVAERPDVQDGRPDTPLPAAGQGELVVH